MNSIIKFIISLALTSIFYCAIPISFSLLTKKTVTSKKILKIVIIQGVCIFLVFLFLGGGSIPASIIWCFIAYKISLAILKHRNLLSTPDASPAVTPDTTPSATPDLSDIVLKASQESVNAGGNFRYIAQNIATIFYCIQNLTDIGPTLSTEQRIRASLYIDSLAYLQNGSITLQDIDDVIQYSSVGMIGNTFMYPKRCVDVLSHPCDELDLLSCATAGVEIYMFLDDLKIDYHDIIDTVHENYDDIASMVRLTISQGTSSPLFDIICPMVLSLFADPDFIRSVKEGANYAH